MLYVRTPPFGTMSQPNVSDIFSHILLTDLPQSMDRRRITHPLAPPKPRCDTKEAALAR